TNCGTENPSGQKFCGDCGSALAVACSSCGSANPPANRFCGDCGAALGLGEVLVPPPAAVETPVAERRLVTVLFADLVGFTTASEGRDAEETRDLFPGYFDL